MAISQAEGAISLVRTSTGDVRGASTVSATYTGTPTENNLLIAVLATDTSVTISTPPGWTAATSTAGAPGQAIFYRIAGASEPTLVTGTTGSNSNLGLHIYEYSGAETTIATVFDAFGTDNTGSSTGPSTNSVTAAKNDELIFVGMVLDVQGTFGVWTNSFIEQNDFDQSTGPAGDRVTFAGAHRLTGITCTTSYSTAATTSATGNWRASIVAFHELNVLPNAPESLEFEGVSTPPPVTGVTDLTPEFTAVFDDPNTCDTALFYQIEVNTTMLFDGVEMWDSTKTSMSALAEGSRSTAVSYAGMPLDTDGSTFFWRIRFWDDVDGEGAVSATGQFTMALGGGGPCACSEFTIESEFFGGELFILSEDTFE